MRKTIVDSRARALRIHSRGRLPHWEVPEGLYAITWRLFDSLSAETHARIQSEHHRLKRILFEGEYIPAAQRADLSLDFFRRLDEALDKGRGSCVLREPAAAEIVRDALRYFDGERYHLITWTVMPNHVHFVFRLRPGELLWKNMRSLKGYTAHRINEILGREGPLWQREYFDVLIRDERELANWIEYVRNNPAKAGLQNWPYTG